MRIHRSPGTNSSKVPRMTCTERARLLKGYARASTELADLVADLAQCSQAAQDGFEQAWRACEEARFRCHQLHLGLYEHVQGHRCALEIAKSAVGRL
jgi:hypothetical protein